MGHGVSTCATCDGYFFRGQESPWSAAATRRWRRRLPHAVRSKVTLVHRRDTLRASKIMQDKARANPKIEWRLNTEVVEIRDTGKGEVTGDGAARRQRPARITEIPVAGVFVAIGHTPNTALFNAQLELDANGYIVTHDGAKTNIAGRVRLRRRAGPHLPAGDHRGRHRLHGGARRRALSRRHPGTSAELMKNSSRRRTRRARRI